MRDQTTIGEHGGEFLRRKAARNDDLQDVSATRPTLSGVEHEKPHGCPDREERQAQQGPARPCPAQESTGRCGHSSRQWTPDTAAPPLADRSPRHEQRLLQATCVEPRLQDRASRRFIHALASPLSTHPACHERAFGLDGREPLVPQFDRAAGAVRDSLRHGARAPGGRPFPAVHVERQANDEPGDTLFLGQPSQRGKEGAFIARVQTAPRMSQQAELVVDGDPDARGSEVKGARAPPALPPGPALGRCHGG